MKILYAFPYYTSSYGECFFAFILKQVKEENVDNVFFREVLVLREIESNDYRKLQAKALESLI
jgi:hypothetical protein